MTSISRRAGSMATPSPWQLRTYLPINTFRSISRLRDFGRFVTVSTKTLIEKIDRERGRCVCGGGRSSKRQLGTECPPRQVKQLDRTRTCLGPVTPRGGGGGAARAHPTPTPSPTPFGRQIELKRGGNITILVVIPSRLIADFS